MTTMQSDDHIETHLRVHTPKIRRAQKCLTRFGWICSTTWCCPPQEGADFSYTLFTDRATFLHNSGKIPPTKGNDPRMAGDSQTHSSLLNGLHDRGNRPVWQRFHQQYQPLLLSFAKRIGLNDADARELVADTLACFVEEYPHGVFDRSKGRLRDWLKGVLRKRSQRLWQRRRREAQHAGNIARTAQAALKDCDPDAAYEREWRLEMLDRSLDVLRRESNVDSFQAFDLLARRGWSAREVAELIGISVNAAYVAKHRMLKRLGEIVRDLEASEAGGDLG